MTTKTHWKKLQNPDFLGAYALEPGKDMILTVKSVQEENVIGADGKKEDCMVMRFSENVKPMIVNATNAKMISKLYKTPYIEEWTGCKIQLFVDKVKAFGDVVEALRIRPFIPKLVTDEVPFCADCGANIEAIGKYNPAEMARYTHKKYGKPLCATCAQRRADLEKQDKIFDPLDEPEEEGDAE